MSPLVPQVLTALLTVYLTAVGKCKEGVEIAAGW